MWELPFLKVFILIIVTGCLYGQPVSISGRIIDRITELPCVDVAITVKDKGYGAVSDVTGWFEITGIPLGLYTIQIKAEGYEQKSIDWDSHSSPSIGIISLEPFHKEFSGIKGTYFIFRDWNIGKVLWMEDNREEEELWVRYRVDMFGFYIKRFQNPYAEFIDGEKLRKVIVMPREGHSKTYINSMEFKTGANNEFKHCFFELLVSGDLPLFKANEGIYKRAKYNPTLGLGKEKDEILIASRYFTFSKNKLIEVPKKKKTFLTLFRQEVDKIEAFLKMNNINSGREKDLISTFEYYNQIKK
ncbi:MAG TPA: carboxypeptidase-like regulatory domain-containing protein [Saprospiraceae bacterium]|nr:carboxypeptidase-like regulatory domain-containing protein [Saprospiraceae bacterium]